MALPWRPLLEMLIRWVDAPAAATGRAVSVVMARPTVTAAQSFANACRSVRIIDSFLKGHETLGEAIQRETTRRLLPQALHAYEVEGHVEFGKLAVSREGLSKGGKILPWSDVACVVVHSGSLLVRRRNGRLAWFAVPMGKVPNLYVYLALVENILVSQGEPSPN